jgi:glyoxylase-like metal-dependent hydrolase (beta-lactamase superfamily II)
MQIKVLEYSCFMASGHAMFGSTPVVEWQHLYPPVEANLCQWALRSLLVIEGSNCVLIDTGFSWFDRRILNEYKVEQYKPAHLMVDKLGISPGKITHVIHTHLHVDHCGGSFTEDDVGNLVQSFPNAKYIVSKKQLEVAKNPSSFETESYQPEIIDAFKNCKNIQIIDNECFIFPWLELLLFNGHTDGMIVPVVHQGKDALVFVGDLIPSIAHLNLNSSMDYDVNKLYTLAEREEFLEEAYENGYTLFFQHDVLNQCCTLKKEDGKIVSDKVFLLNN